MGSAIKITRADHTAQALRTLAAKSADAGQVRRLLALALVLEGHSREVAAERCGMDRQTLRDWVHRYNDKGVAGLVSIRSGGRLHVLSKAQMAELKELALKGPDPERDKVARWRRLDPREEAARRFSVTVSGRTIGRWLRKMGLTRLQPRPFHPKKDMAAQEEFKKILHSCEGGASRQHDRRRQADRDMLPRRSQGGAKGHACLCLGDDRVMSTDGA